MKLYTIKFEHYAPKDSRGGIHGYVLAEDETAVRDYVGGFTWGAWSEHDEYEDNEVDPDEAYMDRMLRLRGDLHDEDVELTDLYYGRTLWGWDEGAGVSPEDALTLVRLGIAKTI